MEEKLKKLDHIVRNSLLNANDLSETLTIKFFSLEKLVKSILNKGNGFEEKTSHVHDLFKEINQNLIEIKKTIDLP